MLMMLAVCRGEKARAADVMLAVWRGSGKDKLMMLRTVEVWQGWGRSKGK